MWLPTAVLLMVNVQYLCAWVKEMEDPNLYQGDMILTPVQQKFYTTGPSKAYGSVADVTKLWPQGIVPYEITKTLLQTKQAMDEIQESFNQYHTYTCIRFVPRTTERDYIKFYQGSSCSSYVGKQTWSQLISLSSGCWWRGVIIHELAHALGFEHEQARPDRDSYVQVIWRNLHSSVHSQFTKSPASHINSLGTPYDIRSIMHYAWNSFSDKMSIQTVDPRYQYEIGQRDGFSHIDIKQINLLYKCNGTYPTLPPYIRPPPGCFDISPFCAKNAHEGRCDQPSWKAFMHSECRRTCALCGNPTPPPTAPTPSPTASTSPTRTKEHTSTGSSAGTHAAIITTTTITLVTKTETISMPMTTAGIPCADRISSCRVHPKERCQSDNPTWKYFMQRSCQKYCGFC